MVQPQTGDERQSNTDRICLPVPFTSISGYFQTQDTGSLAFEVKKSKEYSMFNSIDVLISLSTDIDEN